MSVGVLATSNFMELTCGKPVARGHIHYVLSPCKQINYKSKLPGISEWHISVRKGFVMNITIEQAFVPFTKTCQYDKIRFHVDSSSRVRTVCGHVQAEIIYTNNHTGLLQIHTKYRSYIHMFHMSTFYEALAKQFIHKKDIKLTDSVYPVPNTVHYLYHTQYLWHFSYSLHIVNGFPEVAFPVLAVYYNCSSNADLALYSGMLPPPLTQWRVKPEISVSCERRSSFTQRLDFSFHTTLALKTSLCCKTTLNFSVDYHRERIKRYIHTTSHITIDEQHYHLQYFPKGFITFKQLTYNGQYLQFHYKNVVHHYSDRPYYSTEIGKNVFYYSFLLLIQVKIILFIVSAYRPIKLFKP